MKRSDPRLDQAFSRDRQPDHESPSPGRYNDVRAARMGGTCSPPRASSRWPAAAVWRRCRRPSYQLTMKLIGRDLELSLYPTLEAVLKDIPQLQFSKLARPMHGTFIGVRVKRSDRRGAGPNTNSTPSDTGLKGIRRVLGLRPRAPFQSTTSHRDCRKVGDPAGYRRRIARACSSNGGSPISVAGGRRLRHRWRWSAGKSGRQPQRTVRFGRGRLE